MKKFLLLLSMLLISSSVFAETITITPLEKISTSKKDFQLGDSFLFRDIANDDIYTGYVTYYRPNGMLGQEAQIEISGFIAPNKKPCSGKITIVPENHKRFQEFMNYFTLSAFAFVRGSEICLLPDEHQFMINNNQSNNSEMVINIKPDMAISTCNDEFEYSDYIKFITINDVYKNGKLYIKAKTPIWGIIDSIDENGWCADNAAIYFKKFVFKDENNKKVFINADLMIDGFEILKYKSKRLNQFFNYISTFIRGKEVDIKREDVDIRFVLIAK